MTTLPPRTTERAALADLRAYLATLAAAVEKPTAASLQAAAKEGRNFEVSVAHVRRLAGDVRRALAESRDHESHPDAAPLDPHPDDEALAGGAP